MDAPFAAVNVVCRNASQTKPEGQAAVVPVTQAGEQMPLPTPRVVQYLGKADETAPWSCPPRCKARQALWSAQRLSSHKVPVDLARGAGRTLGVGCARRLARSDAVGNVAKLSSDSPNTAHALPAAHPTGLLPLRSTWHWG